MDICIVAYAVLDLAYLPILMYYIVFLGAGRGVIEVNDVKVNRIQ